MEANSKGTTVRAIRMEIEVNKTVHIHYGESSFVVKEEFYTDFQADGGPKSLNLLGNIIKDTEHNRAIIQKIVDEYDELRKITISKESNVIRLRHQFER